VTKTASKAAKPTDRMGTRGKLEGGKTTKKRTEERREEGEALIRTEIRQAREESRERWVAMEKWMSLMIDEHREVKEELERVKREAIDGRGELKRWLAMMENDRKERDDRGAKYQMEVMKTLTKTLIDHNEAREVHKTIYNEIITLETAMGSTVLGAVSKATGELRWELKKIFEALSEDTPHPGKAQPSAHRTRTEMTQSRVEEEDGSSSEPDSEGGESERGRRGEAKKQKSRVWREGLSETIGGRRGGSGAEGNPIVLDIPALSETKKGENKIKGRKADRSTRATITGHEPAPEDAPVREEAKDERKAMPGQFEEGSLSSLDPTPLPRSQRDLEPELVGALRDEPTIGFIANEVPMEPELSPEPEVKRNTSGKENGGTGQLELETGEEREKRIATLEEKIARECVRQGEADHRREEEEMVKRVANAVRGEVKGEGRRGRGGKRERQRRKMQQERV